jgi:prepilin-type N-terminal cleavage/methylation domain-containing protein
MRQAFTLLELIFVTVIIGLFASVLLMNMQHIKQKAKVLSIVSTTYNGALHAYQAAAVKLNLENNESFKLNDLIEITGKCWSYNKSYKDGLFTCTNSSKNKSYAYIVLDKTKRELRYRINCNNFDDTYEKELCAKNVQGGKLNNYSEEVLKY